MKKEAVSISLITLMLLSLMSSCIVALHVAGQSYLYVGKESSIIIVGYVYKDGNGDSPYNPSTDIPVAGATVKTTSNGREVVATTSDDGKYELDVPSGAIYTLEVSRPAGTECYSPEKDVWATDHSTIKGMQTIAISSKPTQFITANIPVEYLPLNYGSSDFSYEIWHYGPIFKSEPNTVLVHGALIPGEGHKLKMPNNFFHQLGPLLQSKKYGQHNVWDFEYGNTIPSIDGKYYNYGDLNNYGYELMLAISKIKTLNPDSDFNVIAHTSGRAISRYAAQKMTAGTIDKMITLDTGHFGFEFTGLAAQLSDTPIALQLKPESEFLYKLNKGFTHGKFKLLSLAASEPIVLFGAHFTFASATSSSLVQVNSDGSVSYDDVNTPFVIVNGVDHMSISEINDVNHPAFARIVRFLNEGTVDQRDVTRPSGMPYFTVVFRNTPQSGYPKLWSIKTLPNGKTTLHCVPAMKCGKENDLDGYHAVTFRVRGGQEGNILIEYAKDQFAEGWLVKGQSTVRVEVIQN